MDLVLNDPDVPRHVRDAYKTKKIKKDQKYKWKCDQLKRDHNGGMVFFKPIPRAAHSVTLRDYLPTQVTNNIGQSMIEFDEDAVREFDQNGYLSKRSGLYPNS